MKTEEECLFDNGTKSALRLTIKNSARFYGDSQFKN